MHENQFLQDFTKSSSQSRLELQNRTLACYTLLCLVIIYIAAYAAAQQSVFAIRSSPSRCFFLLVFVKNCFSCFLVLGQMQSVCGLMQKSTEAEA